MIVQRVCLGKVYDVLLSAYGCQGWWPAETAFEVCVGAILTQQTSWKNVERCISTLKDEGLLSCSAICDAPHRVMEHHLFSTGFYRQKSRRLKDFCKHLQENYRCDEGKLLSRPLDAARHELLSLKGIGKETADSMLLYAGAHPIFVVDAYTCRILSRLHSIPVGDYDAVQTVFHDALPKDMGLYREYHALLVEHGKRTCLKNEPLCENCVLRWICFFGEK